MRPTQEAITQLGEVLTDMEQAERRPLPLDRPLARRLHHLAHLLEGASPEEADRPAAPPGYDEAFGDGADE